jgi:dihydroxy-acid dehydratase
VAPESYIGGPLALVQTGDMVTVDVDRRLIQMELGEEELEARRARLVPPPPRYGRGYGYMYSKHIGQAQDGCDFDFLTTAFGDPVPEPDIF